MRSKVFPPRILALPLVVLACLALPLVLRAEETPGIEAPAVPPGSAERVARMEAEVKALQEEAARNPNRPTVAQLEQEVKQMIAERNAREARRNQLARTRWLMPLSLGLNLVLVTLLALLLARRRRASTPVAE